MVEPSVFRVEVTALLEIEIGYSGRVSHSTAESQAGWNARVLGVTAKNASRATTSVPGLVPVGRIDVLTLRFMGRTLRFFMGRLLRKMR